MADTPSLLYLDQPLNNVSVGYRNDAFFGEMLFPIVPTEKESGAYWIYGKERFRRYETIRAPGTQSREIAAWSLSNARFFCSDRSLKDKITDEDRRNNALGADLEVNTVEYLNDSILVDLELRAQELILGTSVPAPPTVVPNTTLAGTSQWSDFVNSDPVSAVEAQRVAIKKATAKKPTTFAVGYPVHVQLRQHPRIIDRFKYTSLPRGYLSEEQLASVFEVDNYWVLAAEFDTANEGQVPSLDFIWGKNALLAVILDGPKVRDITLGYEFRWLFGSPDLGGVLTKRYRQEWITSDIIEVHRYDDLQLVVPAAGFLWKSAVA